MDQLPAFDATQIDEVAHLALHIGRLLLLNGADTAQVETSVERFALAFGYTAQLTVNYETLMLTLVGGDRFRTKIGKRMPAMGVGMAALAELDMLVELVAAAQCLLPQVRLRLEALEHRKPVYNRWLVVAALGLTAASLSRLFGGDWPAFAVAWLAGGAGTWLRQEMGRRQANPFAIPFAAATLSGIIGGVAVQLGVSTTPSLCLVAPGMIIIPGVPLINGFQDMIRNHMTLGIGRLGFSALVTSAIAFGLFVATAVTGAAIPVLQPSQFVSIPADAVFSALAAIGFALLFSVPPRIAWACVVCGIASHTTRTFTVHMGYNIVGGTLIGACVVGFLAQVFGRYFRAPAVVFAFPGVVAMMPGAYAFRMGVGCLQIIHGGASSALFQATITLGIEVVLMVAAIAVGIAIPAAILAPRHHASV
jgi:uncharacterized membrane protein YjjP (DUF1212 family)